MLVLSWHFLSYDVYHPSDCESAILLILDNKRHGTMQQPEKAGDEGTRETIVYTIAGTKKSVTTKRTQKRLCRLTQRQIQDVIPITNLILSR
jgi:hypothetical protein